MKKRFISLFLAFALLCTMTISVSAVTKEGQTTGGTNGVANTSARLVVSPIDATASTWSGAENSSILRTTVNFTYINNFNHTATVSNSGSSSAMVAPNNIRNASGGVRAQSQHDVLGGSNWGTWSCSLSDTR